MDLNCCEEVKRLRGNRDTVYEEELELNSNNKEFIIVKIWKPIGL